MRLYEAAPEGEPRGAVVVIQEAFGVNPHIEDVTRRFAAAGYHAVAPDMFHRTGPGAVVAYDDFGPVMEHFIGIGSDDAILTDVDATLGYLRGARIRRRPDRHRRLLLRRPGVVPRRVAARDSARRSASTAAAS